MLERWSIGKGGRRHCRYRVSDLSDRAAALDIRKAFPAHLGNNISAPGVPTIDGMGPSGGGAHGFGEYMDIPSLYEKTALLASVLNRLVGKDK